MSEVMEKLENRERELQRQLIELQNEKIRALAPELYDYLKRDGYVFEKPAKAFKPYNDDFEICVTFYSTGHEVTFYDRKKAKVRDDIFYRSEIAPTRIFKDENVAISFLKKPELPKKYKVVHECKTEIYFAGTASEMFDDAKNWTVSGWRPNLCVSVEEI